MDPTLMDPELSWWAKIGQAERHCERLTELYNRYRAAEPFHVEAVPTAEADEVAYRLRLTEPIPLEIPLIVGDLLHNLRSALDSLVYEMTTRAVGRRLQPEEERACQFPIAPDPGDVRGFLHPKRDSQLDHSALPARRDPVRAAVPLAGGGQASRGRIDPRPGLRN
jgi:hypothetical protein